MSKGISIAEEVVINKIYEVREHKVMLDRDLAELYGVETKYLKRQVRRHSKRFPKDFMFQLNEKEFKEWRSQYVTSNSPDAMGLRYAPYVFTEQGVAQLSTVLSSDRAIDVNIQIIRLFTKMREMLLSNKDLILKMEQIEQKITKHDSALKTVFDALKQLIQQKTKPRNKIGYKIDDND